ncbi:MAG TPA: outer membrane protein transport protein, partial [Bacteroidales bacterium]|nr:outer membrane protein transport protein [Bacteroidales bacterium]
FGFNPIGGGGSAEFKNGLPSFELPLADMVKTFQSAGATGYSLNAYFKGSSIYFGYQFGVAYKINDNISVYGGVRYVAAKNMYEGHLKDINLVTATGSYAPSVFMTNLAATLNAGATTLNGYATNVGNIATALGSSEITFDQAIAQTAGNPTLQGQITAIRNGLTSLGLQNAGSATLALGQASFAGAATGYANSANQITSQVPGAAVLTADQEADVEQTGSGICPIVGVNLSLMESKLNVGLKYEFATKMEVTNKTSKDVISGFNGTTPVTMFPDGAKIPADMPALLSVGVSYKMLDKLSVSSSLYYYFDKSVEYGKKLLKDGQLEYVKNDEVIDGNFIDWALGAEYQLTSKLLVSTGYMFGKQDVKQTFQSDMNYSISSHTYCLGGKYSISPKFDVNLGLSWSKYEKGKKHAAFSKANPNEIALETYMKDTFIVGVGVDIRLSK